MTFFDHVHSNRDYFASTTNKQGEITNSSSVSIQETFNHTDPMLTPDLERGSMVVDDTISDTTLSGLSFASPQQDLEKGIPAGDAPKAQSGVFSFMIPNLLRTSGGISASSTPEIVKVGNDDGTVAGDKRGPNDDIEPQNARTVVRVVDGTKGKLDNVRKQWKVESSILVEQNNRLREDLRAKSVAYDELNVELAQKAEAALEKDMSLNAATDELISLREKALEVEVIKSSIKARLEEDLKVQTETFAQTYKRLEDSSRREIEQLKNLSESIREENRCLGKKLSEIQRSAGEGIEQRKEIQKIQEQSDKLRNKLLEMQATEEKRKQIAKDEEEKRQREDYQRKLELEAKAEKRRVGEDKRKQDDEEEERKRKGDIEKVIQEMENKMQKDRDDFEKRLNEIVRKLPQANPEGTREEPFSASDELPTMPMDEDEEQYQMSVDGDAENRGESSNAKELRFVVPSLARLQKKTSAREARKMPNKNISCTTTQPSASRYARQRPFAESKETDQPPPHSSSTQEDIEIYIADLEEREKEAAEEEAAAAKSKSRKSKKGGKKGQKSHTAFITDVVREEFGVETENAFRYHVPADEDEVRAYNESEGQEGDGPDENDILFDFNPGSVASYWNYACAEMLLDKTDVDYPDDPLDREAYVEMVINKLKRLKHHYNDARPKIINGILETEEEVFIRLGVRDNESKKRIRANQRMRTKFNKRKRIITKELDLCRPGSDQAKYWAFLREVLMRLHVQGMSSDETDFDESTKQKVYRVNALLWRKDISENLAMVDELRDDELHFSTRGSRGFTRTGKVKTSRRAPVKKLPRSFYEDTWFTEVDERRRSLMLKVTKTEFKWLDEQEMKEWRLTRPKRT